MGILLLLCGLETDGLVVDKDAFAFVGFGFSPASDLACEEAELFLVCALEDDSVGLGDLDLDAVGDGEEDGVGVTETDVETHVGAQLLGSFLGFGGTFNFGLLGSFA